MIKKLPAIILLCFAPALGALASSSASEGKLLYEQFRCAECHGADAKASPAKNVPPLAGMNQDLIYTKTKRFVESRAHDNVIAGCGEPPSTVQIKKISDYLATLPR
jgi:cytochrome c553